MHLLIWLSYVLPIYSITKEGKCGGMIVLLKWLRGNAGGCVREVQVQDRAMAFFFQLIGRKLFKNMVAAGTNFCTSCFICLLGS